MGVPSFFRWLTERFPKVLKAAVYEQDGVDPETGEVRPPDTSQPNPNLLEFDNLYLDMNGVIHPCAHPENGPVPATEEIMVSKIFEYVDMLFRIVRPRKVLYMAIDGVAPRAKMNQQRARRFTAVKESKEKAAIDAHIREEIISAGRTPPPEKPPSWDSNVITPGTPFMDKVAAGLRWYANHRLNTDPGWRNVKVVLSTAAVPGEGEHKIMDYIRRQRNTPDYDPNTRHCIYGLDADLIMLTLAMHEPHFSIIREVVSFGGNRFNNRGGGRGGQFNNNNNNNDQLGKNPDDRRITDAPKPFDFLHTFILREYLDSFLKPSEEDVKKLSFGWDLENAIDDWVFLCYFVGNDFLPRLPTLDIREGALEMLTSMYRRLLPTMTGYMTNNGEIVLPRVLLILNELAKMEDSILKQRIQQDQKRNNRNGNNNANNNRNGYQQESRMAVTPSQFNDPEMARLIRGSNKTLMQQFAGKQPSQSPSTYSSSTPTPASSASITPTPVDTGSQQQQTVQVGDHDKLRLGELGWQDRYYKIKFGKNPDDHAFRRDVCERYMEGLMWVMKYYYQGCCSWNWFYPYNYSPFACDLVKYIDPNTFSPKFTLGEPFRPFEQLMGVLPANSAHALPKPFKVLMTESSSPIIDFYPEDFQVDMNGKKFMHQGVVLLPFIDEKRLLSAIKSVEPLLTAEEKHRNTRFGDALVFVSAQHPLASSLASLPSNVVPLDTKLSEGMSGFVSAVKDQRMAQTIGGTIESPFAEQLEPIMNSQSIAAVFENPKYPSNHVFLARLLKGVVLPEPVLRRQDTNGQPPKVYHSNNQNTAEVRMTNQPGYGQHSNQYKDDRNPMMRDGDTSSRAPSSARGYGTGERRVQPYGNRSRDHQHQRSREEDQGDSHERSHERHHTRPVAPPPPVMPTTTYLPPAQMGYVAAGYPAQMMMMMPPAQQYGYPPRQYGGYPQQLMMMTPQPPILPPGMTPVVMQPPVAWNPHSQVMWPQPQTMMVPPQQQPLPPLQPPTGRPTPSWLTGSSTQK